MTHAALRESLDLAMRAAENVAAALARPFDVPPCLVDAARANLHPSAETMLVAGFTEEEVRQRAQEAASREAFARARAEVADAKAHAAGACRRFAAVVAATAPALAPLAAELVAVVDESDREVAYRQSRPAVWAFDPGPIREALADIRAAIALSEPEKTAGARTRDPDAKRQAVVDYLTRHPDAIGLSNAELARQVGIERPTLVRVLKHPRMKAIAEARKEAKPARPVRRAKRRGSRDGADLEALGKLRRRP